MQNSQRSFLAALMLGAGVVGIVTLPGVQNAKADQGIDSLSGNYLAGNYARRLRDYDAAAEYFARALRDDPQNDDIISRTFQLEVARGNFARAAKLAKNVVKNDDRNRIARVTLALQDIKAERYESARKHLEKAAYTPLGQLTSTLLTAWAWAGEKRFDMALKELKKLEKTDSFAIYRSFNAALIADFLGKPAAARRHYRRLYQDASSSLRVVQTYGNYLERAGQTDEALEIYQSYLKRQVKHPLVAQTIARMETGGKAEPLISSVSDGIAEALFSLSSALSDQSGIEFALVYDQLALEMRPGFPVALTLLGDIYEDMQKHEKAVEAYERVPVGSALRPNAEIRISVNFDRLGNKEKAEELLKASIKRDPEALEPVITLANIFRSSDRFEEGAKYYSKAIELSGAIEPRHWTLFYFRGICLERSKRWPEAEKDFRKALSLNNDQPLVLNYLGYSLVDKGENLDEAIEMIRSAVKLRPNDGYIVDSLGWAHYKLGEYKEAVKHLERAVELRPDDPVINDHLGDAYWRVGRKLEAGFQWKHALDNKPEEVDIVKIKKKLESGMQDKAPDAASGDDTDPENKS
ncbi:MAG: tetratricopeptide repeat protein [Hyphomicrobiales bacterium]